MRDPEPGTVLVPASTPAPLVSALGVTLLLAGLVTNVAVSAVGLGLLVAGAAGWFREVLPEQREAAVALAPPAAAIQPSPRAVLRLAAGEAGHRARLPITVYPYTAGIAGGVAGGVAMAALAALHGVLAHGSPWYTMNLLAAAGSAALSAAPAETLRQFSVTGLVLAFVIHGVLSLLVGLLYGALLPMLPRHPALWGGLVAPLLWTGLLAAALGVIDPALQARIAWGWFVASQVAFGLVAGLVVARSTRVPTDQHPDLAARLGLEMQDGR